MASDRIRALLRGYRRGDVDEEELLRRLVYRPFEEHLLGRFDHTREARTGIPEVILAEGKDPEGLRAVFAASLERGERLLATRVTPAVLAGLGDLLPRLQHFAAARILSTTPAAPDPTLPPVLVAAAGSLDRPVAEEARVASLLLGNPTEAVGDVGVAGIGRLTPELHRLDGAGVVIVVAGMDGVLPSLLAGLTRQPVIAVPTSVGYGASFGGLAPLLTMLSSCVPGTAVMNIDNGFGAAVLATKINQLAARHRRASPPAAAGGEGG